MPKTTKVICDYCGRAFDMEIRRIKYNRKRFIYLHFCSRSCKSKHTLQQQPNLTTNVIPGSKTDELSPFRNHLKRIRTRQPQTNLTLNDLKHQWVAQCGKCAISGQHLVLPCNTGVKTPTQPLLASVDRIDSSRGYTADNIQWVCLMAQYAKNVFSNADVIQFCIATAKYQGDPGGS